MGKMAYQSLRLEYLQIPPVSRAYTTACVLTTAAVVSSCGATSSFFQASYDCVFRKRVWAAEKPSGSGPRGGWRHPELTLGFGIFPRVPSQ